MKQTLGSYTAGGATYPEFISVEVADDGNVKITIREQVNLDDINVPKEGRMVSIVIPFGAFMALLDEINDNY